MGDPLELKKENIILVVTVFPNGTKIKFKISFKEFCETLVKDNEFRMNCWFDDDSDKPFSQFYKTTGLTFNEKTLNIKTVELTPL